MSIFSDLFRKPDVPSPSNPELERAIQDVSHADNPGTRETLYRAILASTFIVPGTVSGGAATSEGRMTADANRRIAFHTVEHPPGRVLLPVFTSVEALTDWKDAGTKWVGLRAQDLFRAIAAGNIEEVRVNPFRPGQKISRPGGVITRNEFLALAQGLLPHAQIASNLKEMKFAAGQQMLIGMPAKEPPAELLAKLTGHLQTIDELCGAYLFLMANQSTNSTVIGLHFASTPGEPRMREIMSAVANIVHAGIPEGATLDFMPLQEGSLLEAVRKSGRALFRK